MPYPVTTFEALGLLSRDGPTWYKHFTLFVYKPDSGNATIAVSGPRTLVVIVDENVMN